MNFDFLIINAECGLWPISKFWTSTCRIGKTSFRWTKGHTCTNIQ